MKGVALRCFSDPLLKVEKEYNTQPIQAIENVTTKLGEHGLAIAHYQCGKSFDFEKEYYKLPIDALQGFLFDELCKLHFSSPYMMERSVAKLFDNDPRYRVMFKIGNSMWRWGFDKGTWNEVVDVYDGLRNFTISLNPDFEVRLDYSTGCNQFGYSTFSRTYIDGVFAFLVYYKGKHVMTIGFSVLSKYRILIQQVQSAERSGNRYLYKLPPNRLEHVIEMFFKYFPSHQLYVIEGDSLINKTLADYANALQRAREHAQEYREMIKKPNGNTDINRQMLERYSNNAVELVERIQHVHVDRCRIVLFYENTGKFALGRTKYAYSGLSHRIIRSPGSKKKKVQPEVSVATL
jgi:hypothetical protein